MRANRKSFLYQAAKWFFCLILFLILAGTVQSRQVQAAAAPAKPTLVSLKEANTNQAVLTWKKVSGATGYRVYRHEEKGRWVTVKTIRNASTVNFTDTNLTVGKKYYYTVRAYKKNGASNLWGSFNKTGLSLIAGLSSIKLTRTSLVLDRGKTYTLKLNGTKIKPVWKSENTRIVTVSSSGKITAKATGKTKVTATIAGKKFSCSITVRPVFKASAASLSVEPNKTGYITITSEYSGEKLNATINNSKIISCTWGGWNGNDNMLHITGKAVGTTQITVKSNASGRKLTLNITVTDVNMLFTP